MNILSKLLNKINLEIVSTLSEGEFSLREIAQKLNCSPARVHQAIKLFNQNKIIITEKNKNRLIIKPNRKNPIYQKIKALINIYKIIDSEAYIKLKKIGNIGVYGSYAHGNDDKESDIDLLILTAEKELEVREKIRRLEVELNKKINPLILSKQRLQKLADQDKEFYIRLKLTSIMLNGDVFG